MSSNTLFDLSEFETAIAKPRKKPDHQCEWEMYAMQGGRACGWKCWECNAQKHDFSKDEAIAQWHKVTERMTAAINKLPTLKKTDHCIAVFDLDQDLTELKGLILFLEKNYLPEWLIQKDPVIEVSAIAPDSGQLAQPKKWIEEKMITRSDKRKPYGPYLYERWIENGKQKSKYLGPKPKPHDPKIC